MVTHVELAQREATALSDFAPDSFDTVILNSVAQYFPDIDYLLEVLRGAVALVRDGGHIYVGDVRHLGLLRTFHASVEAARAAHTCGIAELKSLAAAAVRRETELAIDPRFFVALAHHLPGVSAVEVLVKRGPSNNELTRYRYDVVLHVRGQAPQSVTESLNWSERSLAELDEHLGEHRPASVQLLGVPNRRLAEHQAIVELLDTLAPGQVADDLRCAAAAHAAGVCVGLRSPAIHRSTGFSCDRRRRSTSCA